MGKFFRNKRFTFSPFSSKKKKNLKKLSIKKNLEKKNKYLLKKGNNYYLSLSLSPNNKQHVCGLREREREEYNKSTHRHI